MTRSELERRFLRFCRERGLPKPAVNVPLLGYEVDAFWPEQRLVVELDGWTTHRGRASFEGDRVRDAALQVARCRVVRVTDRRIEDDPDELEAELRALLRLGPFS
jgi:very-short-patch-repair endonuclease